MALGTNLSVKDEKRIEEQEDSSLKVENTNSSSEEKEIDSDHIAEEDVLKSQYCVFKAGAEEYAIPIDIVKEVVKYSEPAPIPQMPAYILGMSNVRGNIYGVMDLECFFKGVVMSQEQNYLLVLDHDEFKIAIAIEEVPNSLMVSDSEVENLNVTSFKSVIGQKFLQGIIKSNKRMIILLNVLDMISSQEFTSLGD